MYNLLPLLKGWKYTIKSINQGFLSKSSQIEVISRDDFAGWYISGAATTNDPNISLVFYVNSEPVIKTNPSQLFPFGGVPSTLGYPTLLNYGTYLPGTNIQVYSMMTTVPTGYPFTGAIKVMLESKLPEVYIAEYEVILAEIYDRQKFIQSYQELFPTSQSKPIYIQDVLSLRDKVVR